MTVYIFRRVIGESRGWGVYKVDGKGRQVLVESHDAAPDAKRQADRLRQDAGN
jgi:hypothetical protein